MNRWLGFFGTRLPVVRNFTTGRPEADTITNIVSWFPRLESLQLTGSPASSLVLESTAPLVSLPHLQSLTVSRAAVFEVHPFSVATDLRATLPALQHLTHLSLASSHGSPSTVQQNHEDMFPFVIEAMPSLRSLSLHGNIQVRPSNDWNASTLTSLTVRTSTTPLIDSFFPNPKLHPPKFPLLTHFSIAHADCPLIPRCLFDHHGTACHHGAQPAQLQSLLPFMDAMTFLTIEPLPGTTAYHRFLSTGIKELPRLGRLQVLTVPEDILRSYFSHPGIHHPRLKTLIIGAIPVTVQMGDVTKTIPMQDPRTVRDIIGRCGSELTEIGLVHSGTGIASDIHTVPKFIEALVAMTAAADAISYMKRLVEYDEAIMVTNRIRTIKDYERSVQIPTPRLK